VINLRNYFFIQNIVDIFVDYLKSGTPEDELKALNAFLTAEEAGFPRVKLESVCINIERLLSYSGKIRNRN